MAEFRVVDLRSGRIEPDRFVEAKSPEEAAAKALDVEGVRSGSRKNLLCRVYWETVNGNNMVRLYRLSAHPLPSPWPP